MEYLGPLAARRDSRVEGVFFYARRLGRGQTGGHRPRKSAG
jgi:hypothetical protein